MNLLDEIIFLCWTVLSTVWHSADQSYTHVAYTVLHPSKLKSATDSITLLLQLSMLLTLKFVEDQPALTSKLTTAQCMGPLTMLLAGDSPAERRSLPDCATEFGLPKSNFRYSPLCVCLFTSGNSCVVPTILWTS